jgi:PAS domain S-box-containing protein
MVLSAMPIPPLPPLPRLAYTLAMESAQSRPTWNIADLDSRLSAGILACLVAIVCYLADRLVFVLGIPPDHIASFWPSTAFLVTVLLLVPRRIWPVLIVAGLGAIALADLENGVPIGFEIWITLGNLAETLVAALGISRLLNGVPELTSLKNLAKYILFAVILVPFGSALVGSIGTAPGGYWLQWRLWFFADALAFLTVAPAILNWAREGREWARKSHNYLEFAALMTLLILFGYLTFMGTGRGEQPALLYSLVPLLLWAALRLGLKGVSTSMIVVALLAIWGAVHGRGPFAEQGPLNNVLSLQLFLFFAAIPFTVLAVLVEEQKRAQEVLRESEQRFRLVANTAPVMIWMSGTDKLCIFFNKGWLDFTGRSIDAELGNGWAEGVHPEDLQRCMETYTQAFNRREGFKIEYRLRRHDGEYRWVFDIGVPRFNQDGSFAGYIGTCIDVTERKLAEEALASVSRRLIEAQEQERTRIARELHDDIGQRLAMLTIELEQLRQNSPDLPAEVHSRVGVLREQASGVASDVQSLSHALHSSKLEYLGIVMAMRGFCREFSEQQKVEIEFKNHDLPSLLSPDISLCLFRVLQEALHNSAKYSGVRHFEVRLWGTSDEIYLTVSDSGTGFDVEAAKEGRGLGLTSMEERVKLLKGTLSIESQSKRGTTIHARVPLSSVSHSMRAAG